MRIISTVAALLLATTSLYAEDPDSVAFANASWKVRELERGAVAMEAGIPIFNSIQHINVIRYPAERFMTEIVSATGDKAGKTSRISRRNSARFAINGSYFNMEKSTNTVYVRIGEQILGHTHRHEIYRVNGVVALNNPSGTEILIAHSDTTQYEAVAEDFSSVMATGPVLLSDSKIIIPKPEEADGSSGDYKLVFNQRHPRSVIGTDDNGFIYMVVIDGRFKKRAHGATIWETARICRLLGMTEAINLDGGGSSTLWSRKTGVLNHPSDNRLFNHRGERTVPSIIIAL